MFGELSKSINNVMENVINVKVGKLRRNDGLVSVLNVIKDPKSLIPSRPRPNANLSFRVPHLVETERNNIIDRFIDIIQIEDDDENPRETFYNHPCNRRRNDREEIRRKLAMGIEEDLVQEKRPSLQSRMQGAKSLQICFMNERASDCESQCSDTESTQDRIDESEVTGSKKTENEVDPKMFLTRQAKLQKDACHALAQAKDMAKMQMQLDRQDRAKSPITEIVRNSFTKVGFPFPQSKRRMSRQILTDMNVAQLQVITNDFHSYIEKLNEVLVDLLLERDDLHMEQDSRLVDIEDLTKHLGAKEQGKSKSESKTMPTEHPKSLKQKTYIKKR